MEEVIFGIVCFTCGLFAGLYESKISTIKKMRKDGYIDDQTYKKLMDEQL